MKKNHLVISIALGLMLLLSMVAVWGGVKSVPAHAATMEAQPSQTPAYDMPPASGRIHGVDCGSRTDFFKIWTDNETHQICFADAGTINVKLYNVNRVSTGNNTGSIIWRNDGKTPVRDDFRSKNETYWVNNSQIVNQVWQITIN
ncbi:hypothetical protein KSF_083050 [Reticulibacter mediterranei]|uniref:Streptomyces killer toxin-like beta/gamma crystallin domain-containing protein n=1 Tax=Reticulibacter mediterranei TaxID=2778369 RepID=A0A8J3N4J1_9CHLR|nr:beta/gamma crystallin domain-containing protein [Reticulibacter mediterranei]GHO98257.1 hypothetical protein KSF_083050 [Reticulibacter mediterranei]